MFEPNLLLGLSLSYYYTYQVSYWVIITRMLEHIIIMFLVLLLLCLLVSCSSTMNHALFFNIQHLRIADPISGHVRQNFERLETKSSLVDQR